MDAGEGRGQGEGRDQGRGLNKERGMVRDKRREKVKTGSERVRTEAK